MRIYIYIYACDLYNIQTHNTLVTLNLAQKSSKSGRFYVVVTSRHVGEETSLAFARASAQRQLLWLHALWRLQVLLWGPAAVEYASITWKSAESKKPK